MFELLQTHALTQPMRSAVLVPHFPQHAPSIAIGHNAGRGADSTPGLVVSNPAAP